MNLNRNELVLSEIRVTEGDNSLDRVLHVGCCGDDDEVLQFQFHTDLWNLLGNHYLLGVDINRPRLQAMKKTGFNVRYSDAQNLRKCLGKFDVIIAGELIEHLESPGLFLSCARDLLNNNGRLILTTPNVYGLYYWTHYGLLQRPEPYHEHVCYFTPSSIKRLLERQGFGYVNIQFCRYSKTPHFFLKRWIYSRFPQFYNTMVVTCVKVAKPQSSI